ncbi:MAG: radical family heme chaperone HemW, partial [Bacteroidota bacterium]
SAHSFDGFSRSWNVSNNPQYIKSLSQGITPQTVEVLTEADRYNELVMTGLRTIWGVDPQSLPGALRPYFAEVTQPLLAQGVLQNKGGQLALAPDQWFKADGWAAALFYVADASTK